MTATYLTAQDAIFGQFNTDWAAGATAIVGYIPRVFFQGVTREDKPEPNKHFVRVSVQTVSDRQVTFRGADGLRRYRTDGLVIVQLFAPVSEAGGWRKCQRLAVLARDVYRGRTASGNIWFRNVRLNELPPENAWDRINVIAEYQFDELA